MLVVGTDWCSGKRRPLNYIEWNGDLVTGFLDLGILFPSDEVFSNSFAKNK